MQSLGKQEKVAIISHLENLQQINKGTAAAAGAEVLWIVTPRTPTQHHEFIRAFICTWRGTRRQYGCVHFFQLFRHSPYRRSPRVENFRNKPCFGLPFLGSPTEWCQKENKKRPSIWYFFKPLRLEFQHFYLHVK